MSFVGIASKAGTTSTNIEKLIRTGVGTPGLSSRLKTTTTNINAFINGKASPSIAKALGTTTTNAQQLRDEIGREAAIGLILGLACGRDKGQT